MTDKQELYKKISELEKELYELKNQLAGYKTFVSLPSKTFFADPETDLKYFKLDYTSAICLSSFVKHSFATDSVVEEIAVEDAVAVPEEVSYQVGVLDIGIAIKHEGYWGRILSYDTVNNTTICCFPKRTRNNILYLSNFQKVIILDPPDE